jgi:hypothetical protein
MSSRDQAQAALENLLIADEADVTRHTAWAVGYALLDVADAIREQTAALTGDDKRAILIERNQ